MKTTYVKEVKGVHCLETKASTIDFKNRTIDAVVSSDIVDRDGEIVRPSAFEKRLDTYRKNPVLLFNHDAFNHPPIGKALEISLGAKTMEAKFQFAKKGTHPLADTVFGLYSEGIMNAFSIGFKVFEMKHAKDEETGNALPPEIVDAELFEISTVPVPANPDALAKRFQVMDEIRKIANDKGDTKMGDVSFTFPSNLDLLRAAVIRLRYLKGCKERGEDVPCPELEVMAEIQMEMLDSIIAQPQITPEAEEALKGLSTILSQQSVTKEEAAALLDLRDFITNKN